MQRPLDDTKIIGWLYEQLSAKYLWILLKKYKNKWSFGQCADRSPVELHYVNCAIYLGRLIM